VEEKLQRGQESYDVETDTYDDHSLSAVRDQQPYETRKKHGYGLLVSRTVSKLANRKQFSYFRGIGLS